MRRRRRSTIEDLRLAIDCLPVTTRRAMLSGIRSADIIVGAYTDRDGGVCPMLAAHRHGGRTDCIAFAHAWDRFTDAKSARRATRREVRILERHLEESLAAEQHHCDLSAAIAEHQTLARKRRADEAAATGLSLDDLGQIPISASPGLMNWISGMTHAGDSRSSSRTDSAMSLV
jgi:hypothetical protein